MSIRRITIACPTRVFPPALLDPDCGRFGLGGENCKAPDYREEWPPSELDRHVWPRNRDRRYVPTEWLRRGYRVPLFERMQQKGIDVRFVGSQASAHTCLSFDPALVADLRVADHGAA